MMPLRGPLRHPPLRNHPVPHHPRGLRRRLSDDRARVHHPRVHLAVTRDRHSMRGDVALRSAVQHRARRHQHDRDLLRQRLDRWSGHFARVRAAHTLPERATARQQIAELRNRQDSGCIPS